MNDGLLELIERGTTLGFVRPVTQDLIQVHEDPNACLTPCKRAVPTPSTTPISASRPRLSRRIGLLADAGVACLVAEGCGIATFNR